MRADWKIVVTSQIKNYSGEVTHISKPATWAIFALSSDAREFGELTAKKHPHWNITLQRSGDSHTEKIATHF